LRNLEELAEKLGVDVRYDLLDSKGGFCRYRGGGSFKSLFVVNKTLPLSEKIRILASELALHPLDDIYTLPAVREVIDSYRRDVSNG